MPDMTPQTDSETPLSVPQIAIVVGIILAVSMLLSPVTIVWPWRHYHRSCQSNLKECAIALQQYVNDYDGHLPSSFLVNHSKKWNRRDFLRFATQRGQLPPDPSKPLQTWSQVLYDHMGKGREIMWCPDDPVDHDGSNKSRVSYYWKLAADKAWYGVGCTKPCPKETDFVYNSDQVVLYERRAWHGSGQWLHDSAQINVAYMDTHVKNITLRNATSGDPSNCAASLGEPMYFNFDNKTGKCLPPNVPGRHIDPARYSDHFGP